MIANLKLHSMIYWISIFGLLGTVGLAPVVFGDAPSPGPAEEKIVNGVDTVLWPAVGNLFSVAPDQEICTGTLIGCQTFLTAHHCFCEEPGCVPDPSQYRVYFQHGGIAEVSAVHLKPGFPDANGSDIAVVRLREPVTGVAPIRINETATPAIGSSGQLVGFGVSDDRFDDAGIKREGRLVSTALCAEQDTPETGHICWNVRATGAPGTDASTCYGDSGGPLFMDFGGGWTVAGVTSGGGPTCRNGSQALDMDVFFNRQFIRAHGGQLGSAVCGGLPAAGSSRAPITGFAGSLSQTGDEMTHSFQVSAGTSRLRVGLNGQERDGTDYDLFLRAGAPPTDSDFDCRSERDGRLESCELNDPQSGTWYAMARLSRGTGGPYQLAITAFLEETSTAPAAPSGLSAGAQSADEVLLRWQDNSVNETAFQIERRVGTGEFQSLAEVGADTVEYTDSGLNSGATYTYRIRAVGDGGSSAYSNLASVTLTGPSTCAAGANTLCLNNGRFRVEVTWNDFAGGSGPGSAVSTGADDSGLFWFFDPNNLEMLVKVLDGCGVNDHFWVFAAATTNVGYTLTITDTVGGSQRQYNNPLGTRAPALTDTEAFSACP